MIWILIAFSIGIGVGFVPSFFYNKQNQKNKELEKKIEIEELTKEFNKQAEELNDDFSNKKNEYLQEKNELERKIEQIQNKLETSIKDFKLEDPLYKEMDSYWRNKEQHENERKSKDQVIEVLNGTIKELNERRTSKNTRHGVQLEEHCLTAIENAFQEYSYSDYQKITKNKGSSGEKTKADIQFNFYLDEQHKDKSFGITIECKTQYEETKTVKKNSEHIEKLIKDAKNEDSLVAVLVTELEPDHIFSCIEIKNHGQYGIKVFQCRPEALVPFLQSLKFYNQFLINKNRDLKEDELNSNVFKWLKNLQGNAATANINLKSHIDKISQHLEKAHKNIDDAKNLFDKKLKSDFNKWIQKCEDTFAFELTGGNIAQLENNHQKKPKNGNILASKPVYEDKKDSVEVEIEEK